ncbi:MAG: OmpA family protein, partial [Sulfurovum sp.]|nr:OmpA family protein [Sulfurovum sp.]
MISKFVSKSLEEVLNSINIQIQSGLSFKALKRKFEAKRKGISETQLLLEENAHSNIKAILLIHKETGTLLCEVHNPNEEVTEPEMIASMMTAINSFINDWVDKNESTGEVGEIDYGSSKIVIENAGYAYLAVIINGAVYNRTLDSIRVTLENILLSHGEEIREFNGDLSTFSDNDVSQKMTQLIQDNHQNEAKKENLHPLIYILPLVLISFFIWKMYENNLIKTLETKIENTLYKTPQLTTFRIQTFIEDEIIHINGEVPSAYHKALAEQKVAKLITTQTIQNDLIILPHFYDPMQISANVAYLLQGLNLDKGIHLSYSYEHPSLKVFGSVWDTKRKMKVIEALKMLRGVEAKHDEVLITPPDIKKVFFFNEGISVLNKNQEEELMELSKFLSSLDDTLVISVKGFSDSQGSLETQKYVAQRRAQAVAHLLNNKFLVTQDVITSTPDNIDTYLNINNDANKKRCSIVTIEKQEK